MTRNLVVLTGVMLALAGCAEPDYTPAYSGSSTPPVYAAPAAPVYGNPVYGNRVVVPECAARPADPLHQNRIGGSDYNPERCRETGY
jgi:hypothetical protein